MTLSPYTIHPFSAAFLFFYSDAFFSLAEDACAHCIGSFGRCLKLTSNMKKGILLNAHVLGFRWVCLNVLLPKSKQQELINNDWNYFCII
jgi:hypothetical protein